MVLVAFVLVMFLSAGRWGYADRGLPEFLRRWGEFLHVREEERDLPDVLIAEYLVLCGHAGIADPVANDVVVVPVGIVRGMHDELRHRRIKGSGLRRWLPVETSVAAGTVHGVDLHPVDEVFGGRKHGTVGLGSTLVSGGVNRTHRDMCLEARRGGIRVCGEKAQPDFWLESPSIARSMLQPSCEKSALGFCKAT